MDIHSHSCVAWLHVPVVRLHCANFTSIKTCSQLALLRTTLRNNKAHAPQLSADQFQSTLQATEAAEDAELLILASIPALRQTLAAPTPPPTHTLGDIPGFLLPSHSSVPSNSAASAAAATAGAFLESLADVSGFAPPHHSTTAGAAAAALASADMAASAADTVGVPSTVAIVRSPSDVSRTPMVDETAAAVSADGDQAQEAVAAGGTQSHAQTLPTAESSNSRAARGTADAALPAADGLEMAGTDTDANPFPAAEGAGEGSNPSTGTTATARGKWGVPQQPFTAAGRGTDTGEGIGPLLGGTTTAAASQPTAAVAPATNVSSLLTSEADQSQAAPEKSEAFGQKPATTAEDEQTTGLDASTLTDPTGQDSTVPHQTTAGTGGSSPSGAGHERGASTDPAVATTCPGGGPSDRPAAGQYRRNAWAPVQNPFPAAGQPRAVSQQLQPQPQHVRESARQAGEYLPEEVTPAQSQSHVTTESEGISGPQIMDECLAATHGGHSARPSAGPTLGDEAAHVDKARRQQSFEHLPSACLHQLLQLSCVMLCCAEPCCALLSLSP